MERIDIPLLLASSYVEGDDERFPLDRIRMQKAVFLLAMRGSDTLRAGYEKSYTPYNWGPYSAQLNIDLHNLRNVDMLRIEPVEGRQYGTYITSPAGEDHACEVWHGLTNPEQQFLRAVRAYVTGKSFNGLLREVYAEYPQFATNSRFSG